MERLSLRVNLFMAFLAIAVFACTPVWADMVSHGGTMIDSEAGSVICLSCHDGNIAKSVSVCKIACEFKDSHTIDKTYPPRGKESSFNPAPSVISQGIKLPDGKITCISCHNLQSRAHSFLVSDIAKSKLCLICHKR